ncbi:MAG: ABC transporter permease [Oscillospiraceae bacterium]|jgi:predicted lysophospholipase L1 biosynthesis ABC-type transport system permease subunit|nr:ABC transporter permease [Oscillospiraceae bacterium]
MIIRPKDTVKLFGVLIMCACAVLICTLFLNSNIDLARIKDQIHGPEMMMIYDLTVSSGNMTCAVTGGALGLTTVVMLLFYVKHYIDAHKSELGILKALGYSNFEIAREFWVFGLSVFTGTAIGFGLAYAFMPMFYRVQRNDAALPEVAIHFNPILVLYLIVLPTILFSALAILYSYRKLKRPALELVRGSKATKVRKAKPAKKGGADVPFLRELKRNILMSRFSLVFFIWFASFCYAATVIMSFSLKEVGGSEMMAAMMAGIGIVLAITTLFLAATTVISGNAKTIAMLRVFGYSDRECAGAILSGYRPVTYIGFALGTLYQHGLMKLMMALFFDNSVLGLPEYEFDVGVFFIALASFVVIYELFMLVYAGRLRRVPLKEIMLEE